MTPLALALAALGAALPLSIAGMNAGLAAAFAAVLWRDGRALLPRLKALARDPVLLAAAAYAAAGLVSALLGADARESLKVVPKDLHKLWALAVLRLAVGADERRPLAAGLALGAFAAALWGVGQSLLIKTGTEFYARAHGSVHPVNYGELLALCVLPGLLLWPSLKAGSRERAALTLWLTIVGVALVLNQTRGALLAVLAGLVLAAAAEPRRRKAALGALALAPVVLLVWEWLPTGGRSLVSAFSRDSASTYGARWTLWRVAWAMFRDHLLTGVGPGHYRTLFTSYFRGKLDNQWVWGSAHNIVLHQAAERGLLGLAALAALLGTLGLAAWRRARARPDPWTLGALAAFGALLAMNMTETALQAEQVATLFFAVWALGQAGGGAEVL